MMMGTSNKKENQAMPPQGGYSLILQLHRKTAGTQTSL